jgi:hypothetical protein
LRGDARQRFDAERAGAFDSTIANLLRAVARRVPVDELLELLDRLRGL